MSTPWIVLRFSSTPGNTSVWQCSYVDSKTSRHSSAGEAVETVDLPSHDTSVEWPAHASGSLLRLLGETPVTREGAPGSVPIAVLVAPPTGVAASRAERLAENLLDRLGIARSRTSLLILAGPDLALPPVTFPLRIVDATSLEMSRVASEVEAWSDAVLLEEEPSVSTDRPTDADVVVVDASGTSDWAPVRGRRTGRRSPRLFVSSGATPEVCPQWLPGGASLLAVPSSLRSRTDEFVEQLVLGIAHDLPLHENISVAGRILGLDIDERRTLRIFTTPAGLDALRLSPALSRTRHRLDKLIPYRGAQAFAEVRDATSARDIDLDLLIDEGARLQPDFRRETMGLVSLARVESRLGAAERVLSQVDSALRAAQHGRRSRRSSPRRMSAWVSSQESGTIGLRKGAPLRRGSLYRLHVGIGISWDNDLVAKSTPSIDRLLPETDQSLELQIASFSATSTLIGPTADVITLPDVGASSVVTFEFETPTEGRRTDLRVGVFYKRNLVQLLGISSRLIDATDRPAPGRGGLAAKLLFSRMSRIEDATRLEPRSLAVASNRSGQTHLLMFDDGTGIPYSETSLAPAQQAYSALTARAFDLRDNEDKSKLDGLIRDCAKSGAQLYQDLFWSRSVGHPEFQQTLSDISKESDGSTVQYVRAVADEAFPWELVFDWWKPETDAAYRSTPVCYGTDGGNPCQHTPETTGIICTRGFWGLRLVVEEFLGRAESEPIGSVASGSDVPVTFTVDPYLTQTQPDDWAIQLVRDMAARAAPRNAVACHPEESFFNRFLEANRPAVLVIVAHASSKADPNLPEPPRLGISANEHYLSPGDTGWRTFAGNARMCEPNRPIVLLLACNSGESELGKQPKLLTRFLSIGAAAIVAAEEKIDTELAKDLTDYLLDGLGHTGPGELGLTRFAGHRGYAA